MRYIGLSLAAVLACSVIGCATTDIPLLRWSKAGATYDDYLKDRYACITDGRTRVASGSAIGQMASASSVEVVNAEIVMACLAARGYRQDPMGFGPPEGGVVQLRVP